MWCSPPLGRYLGSQRGHSTVLAIRLKAPFGAKDVVDHGFNYTQVVLLTLESRWNLSDQSVHKEMHDYLVIGSGLYGSVFARQMAEAGRSVLILEKQKTLGGNVHTEHVEGIEVHSHGPHIFHTNSPHVWKFVNRFTNFRQYQHKVKATYKGKIFSLPFNLMTYYQMWGVTTPQEAEEHLNRQKTHYDHHPRNLEEWALSQIGPDLYNTFVYGYTKKQWKRDPKDLPSSIIRRIPVRLTFEDNYYNDAYQGIPVKGYSHLIEQLIDGIEVRCNADFFDIGDWRRIARKLVYSGSIDEFYGNELGVLEYRGLRFENKILDGDFQGVSQMNYTDEAVPYTRIVEHQHFYQKGPYKKSVVSYEYPIEWEPGLTRYYPINDEKNNALYERYRAKVRLEADILVGGRLGSYRYYDMDQVIAQALHDAELELHSISYSQEPSGAMILA